MTRIIRWLAVLMVLGVSSAAPVSARWYGGLGLDGEFRQMHTDDFDNDLRTFQSAPGFSAGGPVTGNVSAGNWNGNLNLFVERDLIRNLRGGFSVGAERTPTIDFSEQDLPSGQVDTRGAQLDALELPLSLYLKYLRPNSRLVFFAGGGATYLNSTVHFSNRLHTVGSPNDITQDGDLSTDGWAAHMLWGAEYFISKSFSVSLGFRYLFNATLSSYRGAVKDSRFAQSTTQEMLMMNRNLLPYGEVMLAGTEPLSPSNRPFAQDFSGIRVSFGLRYYLFGGR